MVGVLVTYLPITVWGFVHVFDQFKRFMSLNRYRVITMATNDDYMCHIIIIMFP